MLRSFNLTQNTFNKLLLLLLLLKLKVSIIIMKQKVCTRVQWIKVDIFF